MMCDREASVGRPGALNSLISFVGPFSHVFASRTKVAWAFDHGSDRRERVMSSPTISTTGRFVHTGRGLCPLNPVPEVFAHVWPLPDQRFSRAPSRLCPDNTKEP
jgi:hypothetical protein